MRNIHILGEFLATADGQPLALEELHAAGENLMTALIDQVAVNPDVTDPAVSSEADRGMVVLELDVRAEDQGRAITMFDTIVRTAMHATGAFTADWDAESAAGRGQTMFVVERTELLPA